MHETEPGPVIRGTLLPAGSPRESLEEFHGACRREVLGKYGVRSSRVSKYMHTCFDPAVVQAYLGALPKEVGDGDKALAPMCESCFDGFEDLLSIIDKWVPCVAPTPHHPPKPTPPG